MEKTISYRELSQHSSPSSAWVSIDGSVYDVSEFASVHPGGKKILLNQAGKDASAQFAKFHKKEILQKYANLKVGEMEREGTVDSSKSKKKSSSPSKSPSSSWFGETVPMGEPSWYQNFYSPYYNDSHRKFRVAVREFVEKEIAPHVFEWDESKSVPRGLHRKVSAAGLLGGSIGGRWPTDFIGSNIAGGVQPEEWDTFHELILIDEFGRLGSGGVQGGIFSGISLGLPPVYHFGSDQLKQKYVANILKGVTTICLAISEPDAGSDVANIKTTATKSADGQHYIVNGQKKWITNGVFADCFTTAVRTGEEGYGGISLLLIDRSPGVVTRQMDCGGLWASGTAYVTFEDVKVPIENLIGKEGEGFKLIMANFLHERFTIIGSVIRHSRVCYEESFRYAFKRKTFGKMLFEHPIIRMKLANMACRIEATQCAVESMAYQMSKMSYSQQTALLGGPMALLKAQSTQTLAYCALEAAQIFGGLGYTRGGQGEKVERLVREIVGNRVPGGSEEIMLDLGMRQAAKMYIQKNPQLLESKL